MLDTIAISLPEKDFYIKYPERFSPNAKTVYNPHFGDRGLIKSIYNPTKAEKERGYKPRLTLFKRPYTERSRSIWLKIEFSAPKLVFGNNFEELGNGDDLPTVINTLLKALQFMGIETTYDILLNAKISMIHYSKNILLDRSTPCFLLIQALEKLDLSTKLDLTQTDFRNSGQMVKYHASTYEIALYDKVKDLEQAIKYGDKRGIENDYISMPDLFNHNTKPEVLRFEIRLTSKKIKPLLKKLGCKPDCTLGNLFSPDISRSVLMYYWDSITNGLYMMNINTKDIDKLVYAIRAAFPKKRPAKIMELIGFITTCQNLGVRGARLALSLKNHQWYRSKSDVKKLEDNNICPRFLILNEIKKDLQEFIPLIKADIVVDGLI
jgi:hypothetical protein